MWHVEEVRQERERKWAREWLDSFPPSNMVAEESPECGKLRNANIEQVDWADRVIESCLIRRLGNLIQLGAALMLSTILALRHNQNTSYVVANTNNPTTGFRI
jgi:hypothetical protein